MTHRTVSTVSGRCLTVVLFLFHVRHHCHAKLKYTRATVMRTNRQRLMMPFGVVCEEPTFTHRSAGFLHMVNVIICEICPEKFPRKMKTKLNVD